MFISWRNKTFSKVGTALLCLPRCHAILCLLHLMRLYSTHMGKSNKKVKSERINALRQQYDAFVEEDKKRKERNEYILGRLDKMRYSTALVPVRQKVIPLMNIAPPAFQIGYQAKVPTVQDLQQSANINGRLIPDISVRNTDETYLIQEISKNYILIPKLRSPYVNQYLQDTIPVQNTEPVRDMHETLPVHKVNTLRPNSDDNADWKSKYEILDILKKEEKGEHMPKTPQQALRLEQTPNPLNKTIPTNNLYEQMATNGDISTHVNTDLGNEYLHELPEKDSPIEKIDYNSKINVDPKENTFTHTDSVPSEQNINHSNEVLAASAIDPVLDIDSKLQDTNLGYEYTEVNDDIPSEEFANYAAHTDYNVTVPIQPIVEAVHTNVEEHLYPVNDTTNNNTNDENDAYVDHDLESKPEVLAEQFKPNNAENAVYFDGPEAEPAQVAVSNNIVKEVDDTEILPDAYPTNYVEYTGDDILPDANTPNYVEYANENTSANPNAPDYVEYTAENTLPESGVANYSEYATENPLPDTDTTNYAQYPTDNTLLASDTNNYVDYESNDAQELAPNADYQMTSTVDNTPELLAAEDPTNAVIPDAATEHVKAVDIEGVEAFDAEQNEMFNWEQSNQEYAYNQEAYNQEDPNAYQEYPQNTGNPYYDNVENQGYPTDMVEDETQQKYDPTYPQQYVDQQEKACTQDVEQQENVEPQMYEQLHSEGLEQQQLTEEQQVYENWNQVETALDAEDGITDKKLNVANERETIGEA